MSEIRLAKIVYQVAKMLVGLLEKEFGLGKKGHYIPVVTTIDDIQVGKNSRVVIINKGGE